MKIHLLQIEFDWAGKPQVIYPVLLQNEGLLVLVDGGYPGFLPRIEAAMQAKGFSLQDLTGLILTHHDIDHIGAAFEIRQAYPSINVIAFNEDAPYIDGTKKSLRLEQAEKFLETLPPEQQPGAIHFIESLKNIKPLKVDQLLIEGESDFLPGVMVIHTPGHMPGHISLYIKESQVLIAADALVYEGGKLNIANPIFTLNMQDAIQSVKKLARLQIREIICYHGGSVTMEIPQQLSQLISAYEVPATQH